MKNIVAVIDVGTLKTKFEVRDYSIDPEGKTIYKDKKLTVMGRDLDKNDNLISEKSLNIAVEALKEIKSKMEALKVRRFEAVTTEAIRRAKNSAEILRKIYEATEIQLTTLSHEEEARILFHSISKDFPTQVIAVADVGGGSVQLVTGKDKDIYETHLFKTGTYYLQEEFSATHHPTAKELDNAKQYIKRELASLKMSKKKPGLLVYGTTNIIEFMSVMKVKMSRDDSCAEHCLFTDVNNLVPVYEKIIKYSYEDRMSMYPEEPYYMWAADMALMNIFQICEYLTIRKIYPSNSNISSGLLRELSAQK